MERALVDRRVVVAVDGGPTAFEAADLVRRLVKAGAAVRVAVTAAAEDWIPALTLETVSTAPVARNAAEGADLAAWAEAVVVLPAGADLLARVSARRADDAPAVLCQHLRGRVVIAPGANLPGADWLQARSEALGDSAEVLAAGAGSAEAAEAATRALGPRDLAGRRVLITAGPTREPIDPVRFLSNPSSGKMGYALAAAAGRRGAEVVLVSGPVSLPTPAGVRRVDVVTAEDMDAAVRREEADIDLFVAVAAVADYRPAEVADEKIKKEGAAPERVLRLVRTPDVLAGLSARVGDRDDRPLLVGFAAETEQVEANARDKLARKGLDLVVANGVKGAEGAFGADLNEVLLVGADGTEALGRMPKRAVADRILDRVVPLLDARRPR